MLKLDSENNLVDTKKTVPETIQSLVGTNGIFHIQWNKKDRRKFLDKPHRTNPDYDKHPILRTGNFRLGVVKGLKGDKRTTNPSDYMIAYDMSKQGYRNIYYNEIKKIVANKKTYYVKVIDTKRFRFGLIEEVEKGEIN